MSTGTSRRLAATMARAGMDWFLATSPDAVTYATGAPVPLETGPSPFAGGPELALVARDGAVAAVVEDTRTAPLRARGVEALGYEGWTSTGPVEAVGPYESAVGEVLRRLDVRGVVGTEPAGLPDAVARLLRARGAVVRDGRAALDAARAVKTPEEMARVRRAVAVADEGHRALAAELARRRTDLPSEIELFGTLRAAMERRAGERVAVAGDLVAGATRCAAVGGWPGPGRFGPSEPVIADLAPRVDGYWADSASTLVLEPGPELRRMHGAVTAALAAGAAVLRPGVPARAVHAAMVEVLDRSSYAFPHHGGHGVGTSVHEFPRIVPGEAAPLAEGMVVALEPGAYVPGAGGVRLERMFEIRADGAVELTGHQPGLVPR